MIGKKLFGGKKITIMGLGILGRGLGDVKYLADCGAELIVTDLKTPDQLETSLAKIKNLPGLKLTLGKHQLEDFRNRDLIIKSASVPLDSIFISEARRAGTPITMSTALFAKYAMPRGVTIIGVTGTRGKSTTTHSIYELIKVAFGNTKQVFLGGNVKDISTLPLLEKISDGDIAILELDSWQLQGFEEEKISPQFSIFTTFLPDHLNYYQGNMEKYLADKANIFLWQTPQDHLILGEQAANEILRTYRSHIKGQLTITTPKDWPKNWRSKLPGDHNRYNLTLTIALGKLMGINLETIKKAIENFPGIPGRLEFLREINGVKIYNDTTSTTPDATMAGVRALARNRNVVLIMGGADKKLDMANLISSLPSYCKKVILLPGTGTDRMLASGNFSPDWITTSNLPEAVSMALESAQPGDVVLFSPAFASFGLFKNEFDRGEQFNDLIAKV